ncbi:YbbR-like domain-containing protein [Tepidiforma sp.]|uniref:CdaR family protein n=1 Tax=Tepidiforma sp. TaxID=2682230 RepID=UPI002ADD6A7F|nr:CdaR family protein [Tepidiforma sp.]
MNRTPNGLSRMQVLRQLLTGSARSLRQHWTQATFSLVAAFAIWAVVQDVENPRQTVTFPEEGQPPSIVVTAENAGPYIVKESYSVRVVAEGRQDDLATLTAADFEGRVDVRGMQPGVEEFRQVRVISRRPGVRVIQVIPSQVRITLVEPAVREVPVTIRRSGQLPAGFRENESETTVEPAIVTISGLPERVQSVQSVDLDVNLSGVKDSTYTVTGELVARSATGTVETVTITPPRATATIRIGQTFVQRTVPITADITGAPAAGYRIASVTIDPPVATVSGERAVVNELVSLATEKIDVTGARAELRLVRNLVAVPNTSVDLRSVTVTVRFEPILAAAALTVAPEFTGTPVGLARDPARPVFVEVRVTGPADLIAALKPSDIRATVNLAGATAGTAAYPVTVTGPTGITIEAPPTVSVTLVRVLP